MERTRRTFYVRSLKRRLIYTPAPDDGLAYDVREILADRPEPDDEVVRDQVAFEEIKVEMGLLKPLGAGGKVVNVVWRALRMDQWPRYPSGAERREYMVGHAKHPA